MTQQDDITQSADWDVAHEIWAAAQTPPGTSIESAVERIAALLSKLRAEGVPVGWFDTSTSSGTIRWREGLTAQSFPDGHPFYAAPVASAPADERAAALEEAARFVEREADKLDAQNRPSGAVVRLVAKGLRAALASAPVAGDAQHPDDIAVDRFAAAMKAKLAKKRAEGRGGWDDKAQCSREWLSSLLRQHLEKGDPVDVGNLAMMLHQRGERIVPYKDAPQASEAVRPDVDAVDLARAGMELHSEGMPEHTVCAELVRLADALKSHPQADKDGGQQKYWLCCGSKDPYHGNRRAPDCFNTTRARWGTADEHSKDARAALSATQTEQGERDA
ncbi:hypothetical protein [Achromobacter xylosoxidans]|uniref:hypothetical protein n=1 Tax=Alcaligenes xylosoxydans xylosoxydans TaxID=85698 RepID=UPI001EEAE7CF|nr:hypothetical protein [Achromobacter xylosoxidans]